MKRRWGKKEKEEEKGPLVVKYRCQICLRKDRGCEKMFTRRGSTVIEKIKRIEMRQRERFPSVII